MKFKRQSEVNIRLGANVYIKYFWIAGTDRFLNGNLIPGVSLTNPSWVLCESNSRQPILEGNVDLSTDPMTTADTT